MFKELPFDTEAITAALAHAAMAQGDAASVAALAVSIPRLEITGIDEDMENTYFYLTLILQVPIHTFGQLFPLREQIEASMSSVFEAIIRAYPCFFSERVSIVPVDEVPADWREQAVVW